MTKSFTYHLTLFVLKLKGLKKTFGQDPIDYKKLRKEDVHHPKKNFFKRINYLQFKISKTIVTEIPQEQDSNKLLIFIHGGAFISGPAKHHWDSIKQIHQQTNYTIWLCDYPKAPESKIDEISKNLDEVYRQATEKYHPQEIVLLGDSVGGTLATALTQRLLQEKTPLPAKLILISPVLDATMTNSEIDAIDKTDPMLSKPGVLSAKKMCALANDLDNEMISPIHGDFHDFPKTILFLAENDITYPDQKRLVQKLKNAQVDTEIILGKGMPHIWPLLPVMKEATLALKKMIGLLNQEN